MSPNLSKAQKIGLNALTSGIQVIVVGLVYLLLYRFLLVKLGPSLLGVWSLVLATASIATMANLGITAGLVKFVADINARGQNSELLSTLYTAFISIAIFFGVLVIGIYFIAHAVLAKIIDHQYLSVAEKMLPFSLFSLFINEVGGVFTSLLDGLQKNYRKNLIYILSSLLLLTSSYLLVPKYGITGMAYGQAVQSLFVTISSLILSAKYVNIALLFRSKWNKEAFNKMFFYGVKFQFISICQMLYEPTTKALLSKFGSLSLLGYYEMASRIISQTRALIVNANQVVVPVVATAQQSNKTALPSIYKDSVAIILLVSVPLISSIIILAPAISTLWIGHYETGFVISLYLLSFGAFFNILCGPAYFGYQGEGNLSHLVKVHIFMAIANLFFGIISGKLSNGYLIIASWSLVLAFGSASIMLLYQKSKGILLTHLLTKRSKAILLCGLMLVLPMKLFFSNANNQKLLLQVTIEIIILLLVFIPFLITQKEIKLLHIKNKKNQE